MEVAETLKKFLSKTKAPRTKKLALTREDMLKEFPRLKLLSQSAVQLAEDALNEKPSTTVVKSRDGQLYAVKQHGKRVRSFQSGVDDDGKPKYSVIVGGVTKVRLTFKGSEWRQMSSMERASLVTG